MVKYNAYQVGDSDGAEEAETKIEDGKTFLCIEDWQQRYAKSGVGLFGTLLPCCSFFQPLLHPALNLV